MQECKIVKSQGYVVVGKERVEPIGGFQQVYYRVKTEKRDGYRVTIPNEMGSSTTFVEHLSEAFSLVGKYDNEAEAINKRAQELGNYLSSDEGAWGR